MKNLDIKLVHKLYLNLYFTPSEDEYGDIWPSFSFLLQENDPFWEDEFTVENILPFFQTFESSIKHPNEYLTQIIAALKFIPRSRIRFI